jgi:hypothetical protein
MRVPGEKTETTWFLLSWEYEATYKASLSKAADILEGIYSRLKKSVFSVYTASYNNSRRQ